LVELLEGNNNQFTKQEGLNEQHDYDNFGGNLQAIKKEPEENPSGYY